MPIRKAIVLAAGRGERMRPYTDKCPKPLLPVGGKPLIERTINRLKDVGVKSFMLNLSYLGPKIQEHFETDTQINFSYEDRPLETGGGILRCLDFFNNEPFWVINGDSLWKDNANETLEKMLDYWNSSQIDILLSVIKKEKARGYCGKGDYFFDPYPHLLRNSHVSEAPFVNTGIQIFHPRIFEGSHPEIFSNVRLYDLAQKKGRLYGMEHPGSWFHFSTPEDYDELKKFF